MTATNSVIGVVDSVTSKQINTKFGDKPVYAIHVGGVEVGIGFKKLYQQGEMVDVGVEYKYRGWQLVPNTQGTGLPPAASQGTAGDPAGVQSVIRQAAPKARGAFPIQPKDGQMSIIRQSSMKVAAEILGPMVEGQDVDTYMKCFFEIALMCADFGSGQDIMKMQAAIAANMEAQA
jgi:hypothetical protein